jgi:hypothetical protein
LHIARTLGFYQDEGLDVSLVHINCRLAATAPTDGEINFTATFNNTWQGVRHPGRAAIQSRCHGQEIFAAQNPRAERLCKRFITNWQPTKA